MAAAQQDRIVELFRKFDVNGDGYISNEELAGVMRGLSPLQWKDDDITRLVVAADTDGDGLIAYEEFVTWIMGSDDKCADMRQVVRGCVSSYLATIHFQQKPVSDFYEVNEVLGEGGFGTVRRATHLVSKKSHAIKFIRHGGVPRNQLEAEVELMKSLDHPSLLQLYEVFEDADGVHLSLELCVGGELFDKIIEAETVTEREVAGLMKQILGGVAYMHSNRICHRDLKPENFILAARAKISKAAIKMADFGTAVRFVPGSYIEGDVMGTLNYMSPQMVNGQPYDELCDVWACGVIMYILFSGSMPFDHDDDSAVVGQITRGSYALDPEIWGEISGDAKDLLKAMLGYRPDQRVSAAQAMEHTWIKNTAPAAKNVNLSADTWRNMREFRGKSRLKKAAMQIIAKRLSTTALKNLKDIFVTLDTNGDGTITFEEMKVGLARLDLKDAADVVRQVMESIDCDWSGAINYTQFLASCMDKKHYRQDSIVRAAFMQLDRDGNGTVDRRELAQLLHNSDNEALMSSSAIDEAMVEADKNGDGMINFQEFMELLAQ